MVASPLEQQFNKAVWLIRNGPPNPETSTSSKLAFYALYKQATEGDVKGAQPWAVQLEARAKWDAWAGKKGMSREEAMKAYIDLVAAGERGHVAGELSSAPPQAPNAPRRSLCVSQAMPIGSSTRRCRATPRRREPGRSHSWARAAKPPTPDARAPAPGA